MSDSPARIGRRTADEPIAIIGMAGLFPMARNYRDYWQNILDGLDCTCEVPETHWRPEDYFDPTPSTDPSHPDTTYCTRGGFVPETRFSPGEFGMPPNQLEVTTTVQLLSLVVARDLLRDAGAVTGSGNAGWYDPARTGVTLGVTGPMPLTHPMAARLETPVLKEVVRSCGLSDADAEAIAQKYLLAFPPWEENTFPGLLGNVTAGRIANRFDLGGMNCAVDAACASSLSALRMAAAELAEGRADLMITGGCDTENTVFGYMCFSRTQALSKSGRIKPFDDSADGTLVGEGIGMLALKRLADAERDGDRVYAVVQGIGSSSDGRFGSIYAPRASGQELALRRAYTDAGVSPASVELFEGHATGTAVGDRTELTALGTVLGEATDEIGYAAIGSVKSQIGHTKGAAGTASLMKLALALRHKVLPPTINIETPNTALDGHALYPNTTTRPWIRDPRRPVRRAAASAMGFGGTNFHVVLEEADPERPRTAHRGPRAHVWHAPNRHALVAALDSAPADGAIPAGDARIGFVSRTDAEADELRELAVALLSSMDEEHWSHPKGIWFRSTALPELKVAALFAGQGSQYVEMGRQAAIDLPPVGAAFDAANAGFADAGSDTLAAAVFPPPTVAEGPATPEESLRRTDYAQPAIGALTAGQYAVLRDFGLAPAGFLGHSYGELAALWAAGSLSEADFHALSRARGRAMAPPADVEGYDPGTMAAVSASREVVEDVLAGIDGVVVCNHNAPAQVVIGGCGAAVSAAVAEFSLRGLVAKELPVAAAFHTSHVDHAVEAFRAAVSAVEVGAPGALVVANSPDASYGADVEANRSVLAEQLRRPVEFVRGLERLAAEGATVFVEFGPKSVLTGLVERTLGERAIAIATDAGPTGDSAAALLGAAVQLVVLGAPLTGLDRFAAEPFADVEPTGMTVTLTGTTHRPGSRTAAYQDALSNGYRVELAAAAAPGALGPPVPESEASGAVAAGGNCAPGAGSPFGAPAPSAAAITDAAVALSGAPSPRPPAEGPAVPTTPSGDPLADHIDLHARYLDSQLRIAEGLVEVLRTQGDQADPQVHAGVRAIADSAVAISRGHTHANEVLSRMSGLTGAARGLAAGDPEVDRHGSAVGGQIFAAGAPAFPVPLAPADPPMAAPATPVSAAASATVSFTSPAPTDGIATDGTATDGGRDCASAGPGPDAVRSALLAVVSEKTGYPVDMIEPGMDLEADLGIDSIKRVQILGAVAEQIPSLPAVGPEQLAEARSVNDIVGILAATPAAASASTLAGPAGPDADSVRSALLAVVSEKTGYPVEMVEPGMDLEADLGIDSIKRVQILGAVAERIPSLPAVGPEQLAELRSVNDIVGILTVPVPVPVPVPASAGGESVTPSGVDPDSVRSALLAVVSEKTGYPVEMVEPGMDLEADLGIDSIKRVQILGAVAERVPGVAPVGPEQLAELRSVDDIVGVLAGGPAVGQDVGPAAVVEPERVVDTRPHRFTIDLAALPPVDRRTSPFAAAPVAWLVERGTSAPAALVNGLQNRGWSVTSERPEQLDAVLLLAGPHTDAEQLLTDAVGTAAAAVEALRRTAQSSRAAFLTVTRIDGGLGHRGTADLGLALQGGLSGLTKTLAREAPTVFARALDVAPGLDDAALAGVVLAELHDSDLVAEVGVDADLARWTPVRTDRGLAGVEPRMPGLTADDVVLVTGGARGVTAACVIALAERVSAEFLLLGRTTGVDEPEPAWAGGVPDDGLKAALIAELRNGSGGVGPKEVEREVATLRARREISSTLGAVRAAGARVRYLAADVADADAVRAVLGADAARVTTLVHGAGALADAALADKTAEAVGRVLGPKIAGLRGALEAVQTSPRVVVFGSVAGVLGNPGQADYAAANEALDRAAATLDGTAIHWGAWDGGMVTPQLKELFAARGVALLDPATGTAAFVEEIGNGERSVLVAPGGALAPVFPEPVGEVTLRRDTHLLTRDAVVADHRIGAHPVLPLSAAIGWMARSAERAHRDVMVVGLRDVGVHHGIVLDGTEPGELELTLDRGTVEGATVSVRAWIGSSRPHFSATLLLAAAPLSAPTAQTWAPIDGADGLQVYRDADLFHGPLLQGLRRVIVREPTRLVAECELADYPLAGGGWAAELHSPVLGDVVLQVASVLGVWHQQAGCLPLSVGAVDLYAPIPDGAPFRVIVDDLRPTTGGVTVNATVTDPSGRVLQRWTDVGAVSTPDMAAKFAEAVQVWNEETR
ncbi:type I polyketide synthase [Pseudonocardia parietis]|uniref:Acyl transferase domain-containing protein/acyl carrier protein/NADP-dependent 3-hydroxy acid dehydrogenase YdfG n=1 Tax=Pseudonocardia parietis TaxID=570936 RepID=A0ABS4W6J6_9PSEU|nr:type I polyketide synthase [Pseudonocardia parietis]MBP2371834.1 acyl transferase domain-containing protein/acyl carrier protein/NADP-dependent 3-hydroxy acid dehydrogenase YdfG [Pseudonocardia parietis]